MQDHMLHLRTVELFSVVELGAKEQDHGSGGERDNHGPIYETETVEMKDFEGLVRQQVWDVRSDVQKLRDSVPEV